MGHSDAAAGVWKTGLAAVEAGGSAEMVNLEIEVAPTVWMTWTRPLGEKGWTARLAFPWRLAPEVDLDGGPIPA